MADSIATRPGLSNYPVNLCPLPSRGRCRFRLIPMKRSHHRDMRYHRVRATSADRKGLPTIMLNDAPKQA
jgi:hypothetical protein